MQPPKFKPGNVCVLRHPRPHPLNGCIVVITDHTFNHFTDMFTYRYKFQDDPDSKTYQCVDEGYLVLKAPNA